MLCSVLLLSLLLPALAAGQKAYFPSEDPKLKEIPIQTAFCARTDLPPVIDGQLNDACWRRAKPLSAFQLTGRKPGGLARHQTKVLLLHHYRFLYLGFECEEPDMRGIRAETIRFDNPDISFDDRIEIFLDPAHDHQSVYNFKINANGVTLDQKVWRPIQYALSFLSDPSWNTEWRAHTVKHADHWTGEVAIAMDRLYEGPVGPGTTWGFNIARDRHSKFRFEKRWQGYEYPQECSAWTYVRDTVPETVNHWYEPVMYGDLVFGEETLSVTSLAFANEGGIKRWEKPLLWGENRLKVKFQNSGNRDRRVGFEVRTTGHHGKPYRHTGEQTVAAETVREAVAAVPIRAEGQVPFVLTVRDTTTGQQLYSTSYATRIPPFVEFDLTDVYAPPNSLGAAKRVHFSPVATKGSLKGLELRIQLLRADSSEPLACDTVRDLAAEDGFRDCLESVDAGSLPGGDYMLFSQLVDDQGIIVGENRQRFTKPEYRKGRTFGVFEGRRSYGGIPGHAVVVTFPDEKDFVFWEHAQYAPWWEMYGMGTSYEWMESWGWGGMACCEPIQDKENRYSRVEVIENSPTRVGVHWRYALSCPNYEIFLNEWVDEYYYFYPDGTGVRGINLWANASLPHEISQLILVYPTGVVPAQMFENEFCRIMNLDGEAFANSLDAPLRGKPERAKSWNEEIVRVRLKNRIDPFLVWSKRKDIVPRWLSDNLISGDIRLPLGGHWPAVKLNIDIYDIVAPDRPYHGWLGNLQVTSELSPQPNTWLQLIGAMETSDDDLRTVAASWLAPAKVTVVEGSLQFEHYDLAQRAYVFNPVGPGNSLRMRVEQKAFNPALVLRGCGAKKVAVECNGKPLTPNRYRTSSVKNRTNSQDLLIWIGETLQSGTELRLRLD